MVSNVENPVLYSGGWNSPPPSQPEFGRVPYASCGKGNECNSRSLVTTCVVPTCQERLFIDLSMNLNSHKSPSVVYEIRSSSTNPEENPRRILGGEIRADIKKYVKYLKPATGPLKNCSNSIRIT